MSGTFPPHLFGLVPPVPRPTVSAPVWTAPEQAGASIDAVSDALRSADVDVGRFNGHSFQIGATTAAAQAGLPDSTIQQLGTRRSSAFTHYLRPPV